MLLDGAAEQSYKNAHFSVWKFQHAMQDQNALFLFQQVGKSICHQFALNMQDVPMRAKHKAVAGIAVYGAELV